MSINPDLVPEPRTDKNGVTKTHWVKNNQHSTQTDLPAPALNVTTPVREASVNAPQRERRTLLSRFKSLTSKERARRTIAINKLLDWSDEVHTREYLGYQGRMQGKHGVMGSSAEDFVGSKVAEDLKAFTQLSTDTLDYAARTLAHYGQPDNVYGGKIISSIALFDEFMSGIPNPDAEFKNIIALYCTGANIQSDFSGAFYLHEVRSTVPEFNRPDLHNMTDSEKNQAAAVINLSIHSRIISERNGDERVALGIRDKTWYTDRYKPEGFVIGGPEIWGIRRNVHMNPEFARIVLQNSTKVDEIKQFMSERRLSLRTMDLQELDEYLNVVAPSLRGGML